MKTVVVNLRDQEYDVYIGKPSKWGNPFSAKVYGRAKAIKMYKEYLLTSRWDLLQQLEELRGKRLGCYCKPKRCHGDVLVELLEQGTIFSEGKKDGK